MSVINKMLRDLDAGQRTGRVGVPQDTELDDVTRGTVSLAGYPPTAAMSRRRPSGLGWLVASLLLAGIGYATWSYVSRQDDTRADRQERVAKVLPIAPPAAAPDNGARVPTAPPAVAAVAPSLPSAPMAPVVAAQASVPVAVPPAGPVPAPVAQALPPVNAASGAARAVAVTTNAAPVPALAPKVNSTLAATPASAATERSGTTRTQVAMDVTAEAQALWDRGARESALQLLRDKVDVADPLALAGGSSDVLWLWVRELTRMEMAEGRLTQSLDRLLRLEPALANQAVAWAMRGNLAQRLGRHAESAKAYQTALQLRPGEPRWMLGAAVSLAADGHAAQASEFALKAQERGALSPEVAAYLRQQGVSLR